MEFEDWTANEINRIATGTNLRRPSGHWSIFKYVGLNTKTSWQYFERTLNDFELLGSTANSLNDPFELSPKIFDDLQPAIVAAAVNDTGLSDRLSGKRTNIKEKYTNLESYRKEARAHLQRLVRYSRIVSFCERSDSPLLWSHYANSYRGACIHFFGRAFRRGPMRVGYVSYSTHRPIFPLSLALSLSADREGHHNQEAMAARRAEADKLYFFTKASDWAYENEIRIIYNVNVMNSVKFSPDGLASIIIGPKMDGEDQRKLRDIVSRSALSNIPIREARLSGNSFSVDID